MGASPRLVGVPLRVAVLLLLSRRSAIIFISGCSCNPFASFFGRCRRGCSTACGEVFAALAPEQVPSHPLCLSGGFHRIPLFAAGFHRR